MSQANVSPATTPPGEPGHLLSYPRFVWQSLVMSTNGNWLFYSWMTLLSAIALVGLHAWGVQMRQGMISTNMTDHVSWGLYIANFTFLVGVAAGAVMMVIPAYLYNDREMHDTVIVGELLAIAAMIMCLLFVTVDMGRPDRFWHLIPGIGRFHWPLSMLTWDVIALNGYLLLNLHICGYMLYMRFLKRQPNPKWYVPFVLISIVWAISIHTVTAFLYCGLGGRPFWNTALLAPRFLASAFVAGPAFIVLALQVISHAGKTPMSRKPIKTLVNIIRVTVCISLLMVISEVFTQFYTGGAHTSAAQYLFFGLDGYTGLVPWMWTSLGLIVVSTIIFLWPNVIKRMWLVNIACIAAFVGIWIEKGMGLIVPGFVPSTLHEIVEYLPSLIEWQVMAGIWAFGLMVYTIALKIAIPILTGKTTLR